MFDSRKILSRSLTHCQCKRATLFDFQIALESGKDRVNFTKPEIFFREVQPYPLWTVIDGEYEDIVYTSPYWKSKLVMLFDEVHKMNSAQRI